MEIEFKKLVEIVFDEMVPKLETNKGLTIFVRERAKFEGWLKVELCEILSKYFSSVIPEKDRIDIVFDNWAIELKTVNTNYRYHGVKNKTRPIKTNRKGVIKDIEKLSGMASPPNKAVLFVVYPVEHDHRYWSKHLGEILEKLSDIRYKEFRFRGGFPGVIYFGLV